MNKKSIAVFFTFLLLQLAAFAQDTEAEMADTFRANGKIYTVVAVLGIILAGLFVFLFLTEHKLSKLEKQLKNTSK